jgi:GNAT superfamily N-acetyltransferase
MNSIHVRRATLADADLLADLGARTFRDTFRADNTEADMNDYLVSAFAPGIQAEELADSRSAFLIAEAGGSPAGYARLRLGPSPRCVGGDAPAEIARFYADAPWIGRGVGAALMNACLDYARQEHCDVVWLDVWERNFHAMAFYGKWGFTVVGSQPFLVGSDLQTDLLMARTVENGSGTA